MSHDHNSGGHAEGAHEKTDMNIGPMVWIIPACLVFLVVFVTVVVFLTAGTASVEMRAKQVQNIESGRTQLVTLRAHEDSVLNGLVKDSTGHQGIPIARAMEILAARSAATPRTKAP